MLPEEPRAFPLADFASQRLGDAHPLCSALKRGVAFHHAALPVDVLEELEEAFRDGMIHFMTCTSTLTEGVNLPVRTVVIADTQWEGQASLLTGARLVNAMGRAGRAGKESEGWIVLVRAAKERTDDFDLMRLSDEDLEVRSLMATDEALEGLAEFEERVRRGEDAVFSTSAGIAADFVSFIWFVLASEERRDARPEDTDLDGLLDSTLGFAQLEEGIRERWCHIAKDVRKSYIVSPPGQRVTWALSGTSLATSRQLNVMAAAIVKRIEELLHQDEDDEDAYPSFQTAESALHLLSEANVLPELISLPENGRSWQFRMSRSGRSPEVVITPNELLAAWVHGESLADMAECFLAEVQEQDWRVEQMVDAVTQHFEHFLAWQLAALVELVNELLDESGIETTLCPELPVYVRYGVDSGAALRLLMSGVRSRRLANLISDEAEREGVAGSELRAWLTSMDVAELRARFSASSSELLDLLDYARSPNSSLLREFLEQGRAEIPIVPAYIAGDRPMQDETGEPKQGQGEGGFVASRRVNR